MTKEAVESVIGRAVLDGEFRESLFAEPDEALAGYELAEEEAAGLKSIDAETMEALAGTLDERISKSTVTMDLYHDDPKNPGKRPPRPPRL